MPDNYLYNFKIKSIVHLFEMQLKMEYETQSLNQYLLMYGRISF
jgi:hypothetical protein